MGEVILSEIARPSELPSADASRSDLRPPNYVNHLRRLGYGEDDLACGGGDRLVGELVAGGDERAIAARVAARHDAGADHVCIHVIGARDEELPRDQWRRLAPVLLR
jgi:hypothetical protein